MNHSAEHKLNEKGVKPTVNRLLVYDTLEHCHSPQTLADLEVLLPTLDKSSISRVLNLFAENDIVHSFEDGRGVVNYELCREHGHCDHSDDHVHFYCVKCHRSFCLQNTDIHDIRLPQGFVAQGVSFVIKGLCDKCS